MALIFVGAGFAEMSAFALPREALGGLAKEMPERARQVAALGALVGVSSPPLFPCHLIEDVY